MSVLLVVTFTGPDHPGIVDELAGVVAGHGGNWEESRMASLAGRFAGILKICVPDERTDDLLTALEGLEASSDLSVLIDRGEPVDQAESCESLQLELTGADHEGIVKEVSHVLATRGINILELNTEAFRAPMSGQQVFKAEALLECPPNLDIDELQQALERLAHDLVVSIDIHPAG